MGNRPPQGQSRDQRLKSLAAEGLGLSIISLAELYEGVIYSRDPAKTERELQMFLPSVTVLGVDMETCRIFGKERGRLRSGGKLIGDFDLLIGASAMRHNLVLLTNNRQHFERIEGLQMFSQ